MWLSFLTFLFPPPWYHDVLLDLPGTLNVISSFSLYIFTLTKYDNMKGHIYHAHTCSAQRSADITQSLTLSVLLQMLSGLCYHI